MIALGYLVAVILLALGVGILASGWTTLHQASVLDQKYLLLFIQVTMAFVGAIAAAILTATVGRSNEYLRSKLAQSVNDTTEILKAELTQSVNDTTERLKADLTESVNETTERLKADLTKSGDTFRAELNQLAPRRHAAYHAIWAALAQYFRAVQKFEAGVFDEGGLKAAEQACNEASGQTLLIDQTDDDTFHVFWQELARLSEIAGERRELPDGLRTIWRNEGRNLGNRYQEVRQIFGDRLRS
jgi:hypothetical protein